MNTWTYTASLPLSLLSPLVTVIDGGLKYHQWDIRYSVLTGH